MNSKENPLILVTNDDGIEAEGIRALVEMMKPLGEVYVVAPDKHRSGMSHAITVDHPLFCKPYGEKKGNGEVREWACSGTPVDCVKLALSKILPRKPDLCVSGINRRPNSSINILYSGTMAAAMEAAMNDIPSLGISLCDFSSEADFNTGKEYILDLVNKMLNNPPKSSNVLNVNIPVPKEGEIKGMKICKQGPANWKSNFDERKTPFGRPYYWMGGELIKHESMNTDTDIHALSEGFISVVPVQFDMTAHTAIPELKEMWQVVPSPMEEK